MPPGGSESVGGFAPQRVKEKSSKTEHKTLSFRTEEYDEESGIFSGYAAVYGNIDSGGDIVNPVPSRRQSPRAGKG